LLAQAQAVGEGLADPPGGRKPSLGRSAGWEPGAHPRQPVLRRTMLTMIAEAWGLKEAFRSIYRAKNRQEAEHRLDHFLAAVERAQLPAFTAFADGVRLWRAELLAYFDEPTTNGYAEGVINKVKVIKRHAYGLPNFDGFRERVLIACA
jgi:transposase